MQTGKELTVLKPSVVDTITITSDDRLLAAGIISLDDLVDTTYFWDTVTQKQVGELKAPVHSILFIQNDTQLAVASGGVITVYGIK